MTARSIQSLAACVCAGVVLMLGCSTGPTETAGSETTNGIAVAVKGDTLWGRAEPGAVVALFSSDYVPHNATGYADSLVVGQDSTFAFTGLQSGHYTVVSYDAAGALGALVDSVPVMMREPFSDTLLYDSLHIIEGTVVRDMAVQPGADVYIGGTGFHVVADAAGRFVLSDVPAGDYCVAASYIPMYGADFSDSVDVSLGTGRTRRQITFVLQ